MPSVRCFSASGRRLALRARGDAAPRIIGGGASRVRRVLFDDDLAMRPRLSDVLTELGVEEVREVLNIALVVVAAHVDSPDEGAPEGRGW